MITILAEKFDVGYKIAAFLEGIDIGGVHINIDNADKYKPQYEKELKRKGVIYAKYQGNQYAVTWAQGHLMELKQAQDYNSVYSDWKRMPMPFFPQKYESQPIRKIDRTTGKRLNEPDPFASRQLQIIKTLFERSEYVINATDDDREGEAIFGYIYEYIDIPVPYKRLIQTELSDKGLTASMNNLLDSSAVKNKEIAGRARGIADWCVGANLTAIMSIKFGGSNGVISVGRVQTAVLNMIVKRENEIKNFKSEPFWNIYGNFTTENGDSYKGKLQVELFKDKNKAEKVLNDIYSIAAVPYISCYEKKPGSKQVPLFYSLPTLQVAAARKYGLTAKEVLDIAQSLYMKGYTTYPRTESSVLNDGDIADMDAKLKVLSELSPTYSKWINAVPADKRNFTKRHFNSKKVESHGAIVTTSSKPQNLSDNEKKIYDLVARSVIRSIYKPAVLEKTHIITKVGEYEFSTNGSVIIDPQWLIVGDDSAQRPQDDNSDEDAIPSVKLNDRVKGEYYLKDGMTKPPVRYDDGSILVAMKSAGSNIGDAELEEYMANAEHPGLGTGATMANIVETLFRRRYVERQTKGKKTYFVPTSKGVKLIEVLPVDEIKSIALTAHWEHRLFNISRGQEDVNSFISDMQNTTSQWVSQIQASNARINLNTDERLVGLKCPICGAGIRESKFGYVCSGYKKDDPISCRFSIPFQLAGAKISPTEAIYILKHKRSSKSLTFKSKEGNSFNAYLHIADNKLGFTYDTGYKCPICHMPLYIGKKNVYCKDYKNCDFRIWTTQANGQISLTDKDISDLLSGKATRVFKNLISKSGKSFDASLKFDESYKIKYEFPKTRKKK